MPKVIKDLFASKKFVIALISVIAWAAGRIGWNVDPAELTQAVSPFLAFIVGQGIADLGKAAKPAASTGAPAAAA